MLFFIKSAPCRLAPNEALPHTPLGALPLDPTSPLAPGLSVRFISRFARCFILLYACNLLWSAMLIPHSSFLIPHSSFLIPHFSFLISHSSLPSLLTPHLNSAPIKNFPLIIPPKSAILLISKIARNHNHKEVYFYELYSFQKLLSVL